MYLYFNGDSFVAGAELGDDILPGYPGLETEQNNSSKERQDWFRRTRLFNNAELRKEYADKITKSAHERSFANKLASKLNVNFLNNAKGGSSMDRIARTTITDLIKLKQSNTDNIVAFIGTTNFNRSEIAVNPAESGLKGDWDCLSPNYTKKLASEAVEAMRKYKITYETDYHGLVNFYKNVILIKDFCNLNNIKLFWIAGAKGRVSEFLNNPIPQNKEDFLHLRNYADLSYTLDFFECYKKNFLGQKVFNAGGHFGEVVQEHVAEQLEVVVKSML